MTNLLPPLLWAGLILGAAALTGAFGLGDAASLGITTVLCGGAVVTLPRLRRSGACCGTRA